jgi:hypothetical protein
MFIIAVHFAHFVPKSQTLGKGKDGERKGRGVNAENVKEGWESRVNGRFAAGFVSKASRKQSP